MKAWLIGLILVAGCVAPASQDEELHSGSPGDLLAEGPWDWVASPYDAGTVRIGGPDTEHSGYEYESRIRGHLWMPQGTGPFPLAVLLHGQHAPCGIAGFESPATPTSCEPYLDAYANHMGYAYLAEHLASHGIAAASVLATEVNTWNGADDTGMHARGELVLATIDALQETVPESADRLLPDVALMGHSRGGEGAVAAALINKARDEPVALHGVVAIAPTDFNGFGVGDVPLLVVVPYCDGDVSTLAGLRTYDRSLALDQEAVAVKAQVLAMGANHNHYNTKWTREAAGVHVGDDGVWNHSRHCALEDGQGGGRWNAELVREHAITHVNGFLRWTLGDSFLAPYFDGIQTGPCEACDDLHLTVHLNGRMVLWNTTDNPFHRPGGPQLAGFTHARHCSGDTCAENYYNAAPAMVLAWQDHARIALGLDPATLSGMDTVAFRAAVPDGADPPRIAFVFHGPDGDVRVPAEPPQEPPGTDEPLGHAKIALTMVQASLPDSEVERLEIHLEGGGRLILAEAWTQAP